MTVLDRFVSFKYGVFKWENNKGEQQKSPCQQALEKPQGKMIGLTSVKFIELFPNRFFLYFISNKTLVFVLEL